MVDQIADKFTAGIPSDLVANRTQTEEFMQRAETAADNAAASLESQTAENAANRLQMADLLEQAQDAAAEATAWVNAGAGVSIGPEEPDVKRNGHVWLVESSKLRDPLYPSASTWPGAATFPERVGSESDNSHVIVNIRRWDADGSPTGGQWTDFTLAQSLVSGSASHAALQSMETRVAALETAR